MFEDELGFVQCSDNEYRSIDALNFHKLANFIRDPALFQRGFFEKNEPSDAMRLGTAIHFATLYGLKAFNDWYVSFVPPINVKTGAFYGKGTKTYQDAFDAFSNDNDGRNILSLEEYNDVVKIAENVLSSNLTTGYFQKNFRVEQTVVGYLHLHDLTVKVKGRIDLIDFSSNTLIDLKTTSQLDDATGRDKFRYAIYDYKYLLQLAFYRLILNNFCDIFPARCSIIAAETSEPFRVAEYVLTPQTLDKATDVIKSWIMKYALAKKNNIYASRFDKVQSVDFYDDRKDLELLN